VSLKNFDARYDAIVIFTASAISAIQVIDSSVRRGKSFHDVARPAIANRTSRP
jgi:hypothetical protein